MGGDKGKVFMEKSNDHKDYALESKLKLFKVDLKEKKSKCKNMNTYLALERSPVYRIRI